ncbi:MAG: GMC family oxidoreductase [Actinomycetota bacterium]|nr:GMC family oxidoreductase [Actinomycetota bacterium]
MRGFDYDAIVVGSGFGGAVSACRLAEAGMRVCVLERGKRYPPGSFARTPLEMSRNFWDPSEGLHGLFDIWSFRGLEAVVASGLGGGSLIYANVLLRKDEKWFVKEDRRDGTYEHWPVSRADLDPHYDAAETMLGANTYPFEIPPYSETPKTLAMRDAARGLGVHWQLPNLAVSFGRPHPVPGEPIEEPDNLHGRRRFTCRLCGECDVGCNFGSKNTLDFNYLTVAHRHGAVLMDRCEMRRFERRAEGGFTVHYVSHPPENEGIRVKPAGNPVEPLTCRVLVLSAGALGSTYLMLKNRSAVPKVSSRLGTRFCGNGDLLGFVTGSRGRLLDPSNGPVITSTMRVDDTVDGGSGRGFYLQDGGYPGFVNWILETSSLPNAVGRAARFVWTQLWSRLTEQPKSEIGAQLGALIGDSRLSAGTLPMLGMGRDMPDGTMRLRKGWLDVDWTTTTSKAFFARVRELMTEVARELDSELQESPSKYLSRVVTVHPLGGCPMGRDDGEGVVDSYGEVFGYEGLFVADGSVMPGPTGPNPCLTIAALTERFSARMIERSRPRG